MRNIGGEIELKREDGYHYVTDSGRSSLRLILNSETLRGKKCLLPDFLCPSIIDVFNDLKFNFSFYHVNEDLTLDLDFINAQEFDALYVINYFGNKPNLSCLTGQGIILIEDGVFQPEIELNDAFAGWAGFNSFRKISPAADGSMVRSSFPLPGEMIRMEAAPFAAVKYEGRQTKYNYIYNGSDSEEIFLSELRNGEKLIDEQKGIYRISDTGMFALTHFFKHFDHERRVRIRNMRILAEELADCAIRIRPDFPSVFVIAVDRRDELREFLFSHHIFLPVHWPAPDNVSNPLYSKIISIPVDSRYEFGDMLRVAMEIREFLNS